jgi:protein-L-isoaspartate(D-aspartate) O-methyltransferase
MPSLAAAVLVLGLAQAGAEEDLETQRVEMVKVIEAYGRDVAVELGRKGIDDRVLEVMNSIPRHRFVSDRLRDSAYADRPLPIGYGQTISQPFIVALMTDLLDIEPEDVVLEIGTGSGYQAAVLARLVDRVCTIEIVPPLGESAAVLLERLGYGNVRTMIGDGYYGWPDCGPFDGIVVTAAASHVPPPLIAQLKPGGRMVIPVGGPFSLQHLMLVEKRPDGGILTRQMLPVRFVPLTRQ